MYLVTGATGKAGRHVVTELLRAGEPVRALTRDPAGATGLPPEVEVVAGDLNEPASLDGALDGVVAAHLLTAGGADYAALTQPGELAARMAAAGVERVTLLWNGAPGPVEAAFAASPLRWTRLEPVDFMGNALAWAPAAEVAEPFADVGVAVVHEADVGAVAASVLREPAHAGETLTITGGEVLSPRQRVAALSRAAGREIPFVALTEDEARARMRENGVQEAHIDLLLGWQRDPPAAARTPAPTVEAVTGRPPRTFA